jgi:predicted phosphodiesterase
MRYLVMSDIHGNLEALDAVLDAGLIAGYDRIVVLGDLVGYGPEPNGVVERIRSLSDSIVIRGNHDKVASGVADAEGFNPLARIVARWTMQNLSETNRIYLAGLPAGPLVVDDLLQVCHGTPFDEDAYVLNDLDVLHSFDSLDRPLCLFGHTHLPAAWCRYRERPERLPTDDGTTIRIQEGFSYLVNPGSVGQPRDRDARAAYATVDTGLRAVRFHRQRYPVEAAQEKVLQAGLPNVLAERLAAGR